ncbi:hypothetical protein CLOP_g2474 [Closterium sp. NIES-67]|nr:hypothetical protein CLOP_g2474 [Closterium sp. NIES-67]
MVALAFILAVVLQSETHDISPDEFATALTDTDPSDSQDNILSGGNMLNVDGSGIDGIDAGAGQSAGAALTDESATGNGAAGLLRGNSPAGDRATSQAHSESSSGTSASGDAGSGGGGGGAGQEYTIEALPTARQVEGAAVCHEEKSFWVNSHLRTVACNASQPLITSAPDMLNNIFVPLYACPFQERLGPWGEGGKWICNVPSAIQASPVVYSVRDSEEYGFELAASIALHTRPHVFSSSLSAAQQAAVRALAHVEYHEVGLALAKDAKASDVSLADLLAAGKHSYVDVLYVGLDCQECELAFIRQLNSSFGSNPATGLARSGGLLPFGQIMMLLTHIGQTQQMLEVEYTLENLGYRLFHVETKANGHLEVAYIHASLVQPPKPADCPVDTSGLKYPDHQQIDDASLCHAESTYQVNLALRRAALGAEQPLTLSLAEMKDLIYVPLYPCPYEERIGEWGDGGKWICMIPTALQSKPLVYSVGSNEQFAFEQGMAESVRTKAFTFDPFISAAQQAHMRSLPFLHFHAIGVAGEESLVYYHKQNPTYDFRTLAQLMAFLNHSYVDVLKIDCEGCEVAFVRDIARAYGSEPAALASNGGVLPFGQVLMELHQITNTKVMLALLYTFESLGYRLFHVETNPLCLICIEVAYIHDSLLLPANPQACPKAPLNDPATLVKIAGSGGAGRADAADLGTVAAAKEAPAAVQEPEAATAPAAGETEASDATGGAIAPVTDVVEGDKEKPALETGLGDAEEKAEKAEETTPLGEEVTVPGKGVAEAGVSAADAASATTSTDAAEPDASAKSPLEPDVSTGTSSAITSGLSLSDPGAASAESTGNTMSLLNSMSGSSSSSGGASAESTGSSSSIGSTESSSSSSSAESSSSRSSAESSSSSSSAESSSSSSSAESSSSSSSAESSSSSGVASGATTDIAWMEPLGDTSHVEGAALCHADRSYYVNSHLRTVACNASQPLITNAPDMLNNIFVPLYACPFQERLGPWGEGGKWVCMAPTAFQSAPVVYSVRDSEDYGFELAASIALHTRPHVFSSSLSAAQQAAVRALAHVEYHEVGLALAKDAKASDVSLADLLAAGKHSYVDVLYVGLDCQECELAFIRQLNSSFGSNPATGLARSGGLLPFGQIMMLLANIQQTRQMLEVEYTLENLGYRLFHVETKANGHLEVAYIHASLVQPPKPADCPVDTSGLKYPDHQQIDDTALCQAESAFQVNLALRRAALGAEQPLTLSLAEMKELIYVPLYPCPYEERIGEWGDGGKWVCMIASALQKQPLVYSVGSNEQFAFEQGMAESVRTKAFTFDPFISAAQQAHMRSLPFLHFHAIGVAGEESLAYYHKQNPTYDFRTLAQLMAFLNHSYVDVLKIDCEGCEVAFVRDIARAYGSEPAALASNGGVLPFGQVLMELHQITNTKAMLALLYTFESLGYRLFHVETNPLCLICIEVAYIHESLLLPANPQACPKAPLNDPATLAKISGGSAGAATAAAAAAAVTPNVDLPAAAGGDTSSAAEDTPDGETI